MEFTSIFVFIFGIIVGSFLNVVILRLNTGRGIGGRSFCFSCEKQLRWYELIPLFSYLFLKGSCRKCHSGISIQYPLVEFATGALFLFFARDFNFSAATFYSIISVAISWLIWSVLLVIFVYDLKHQIIPNLFVFAFIGLSFFHSFLFCAPYACETPPLLSILISGGALFLFFFTLWLISDGKWVGFGDAKLAIGIGFYLDLAQGLSALAFAFWIGAIVGVAMILAQKIVASAAFKGLSSGKKTITMKSAIPFAPFLIIGTFLAEALKSDVFHIHSIFF